MVEKEIELSKYRLDKAKEMSKILTSASSVRNKSDYDDFFIVSRDEVEKQINSAEVFIIKIEKYLKFLDVIN